MKNGMFDLAILPEEAMREGVIRGTIRLGALVEAFEAVLGPWQVADYSRQWLGAARRLTSGGQCAGFVTSYNGPEANFHVWWPAWREEEIVYLQNKIVLPPVLGRFDPYRSWESVGARTEKTEDGEVVSQCAVPVGDIADYASRRSGHE
jgi:CdiI N-terminal domain